MHKSLKGNYSSDNQAWALDEVSFISKVTLSSLQKITDSEKFDLKNEGVYISGLWLEGAKWYKNCLDEPDPKTMFHMLPLLWMSAEK